MPRGRRRRKKTRCGKCRRNIVPFLLFFALISIAGFFVPRIYYGYAYGKPAPWDWYDWIIGEFLACMLAAVVMCCTFCCCKTLDFCMDCCCFCCADDDDDDGDYDDY
jgi:hypothetical protein